jgi:two-component system phosphate regulon sensor histidine kinase PhoR
LKNSPKELAMQPSTPDWSQFIIRNTPSGVLTLNSQGQITDINPAAEALTGYSRPEALGLKCDDLLPCETSGLETCPISSVILDQKQINQELLLRSRSGRTVPVMLNAFPLKDDRGVFLGGVVVIQDIAFLKGLEKERRHLVNMFAHDLKTPVVGMAGLLQRLLQGKVGPLSQEQIDYLEFISKEMKRLEKLIGKFLEFARLDMRILTPLRSAIQVETACQEVINLLLPLAEAKGMELKTDFPREMLVVSADPLLLKRVLENLLENAIKYSPPETTVVLKAERKDGEVRFAVQDQGPGIPPEDLPHLFEFFSRGTNVGEEGGFGLGLATVKRIIDAHGGQIWVDSSPGKSATFFFTFALEKQENILPQGTRFPG